MPQKLRIQFLEGVDGAAPSHNPPTVRARAAREDKNALSCSPRNSQRPSCTIGSSCYRYNGETCDRPKAPSTKRGLSPKATGGEIPAAAGSLPCVRGGGICEANDGGVVNGGFASLPKNSHFSVKTAILLTCDPEIFDFYVRGLPSHGLPQWRPFGQTASLFLAAASRAQLRANGLKTFVLSSPAQYRISVRGRELHVFRCV